MLKTSSEGYAGGTGNMKHRDNLVERCDPHCALNYCLASVKMLLPDVLVPPVRLPESRFGNNDVRSGGEGAPWRAERRGSKIGLIGLAIGELP